METKRKKPYEKAESINNMTKELEGLEEGPKSEIHIDILKTTLKNIKLKTPGHDGIHGFWFKKNHLHSRKTSTRNEQMPTRSTRTRMDDQRKDHINPKGPKQKKNAPNNHRPINCLPMIWKI